MSGEGIDQEELDRLLAESPVELTAIGDTRYRMAIESRAGALWLCIEGMVMQPIPDEFIQRLHSVFTGRAARRAIIDLRRCTYISSLAMGLIVEFFKASNELGGQVLLLRPPEKVMKLVQILGLDAWFLVVEDEEMALRYWIESER